MFPILVYVDRKQVHGCRGVYFPSWPNETIYIHLGFIHGKTQNIILLLTLTQESLGQKVEPNNLVFLWNYESKIILNTWFLCQKLRFENWWHLISFLNWPAGSASNGSYIILIWLCLKIYQWFLIKLFHRLH